MLLPVWQTLVFHHYCPEFTWSSGNTITDLAGTGYRMFYHDIGIHVALQIYRDLVIYLAVINLSIITLYFWGIYSHLVPSCKCLLVVRAFSLQRYNYMNADYASFGLKKRFSWLGVTCALSTLSSVINLLSCWFASNYLPFSRIMHFPSRCGKIVQVDWCPKYVHLHGCFCTANWYLRGKSKIQTHNSWSKLYLTVVMHVQLSGFITQS